MTKVFVSMLLINDVYTCWVRDLGSGVLSFRVHADLVKWQVLQLMLRNLYRRSRTGALASSAAPSCQSKGQYLGDCVAAAAGGIATGNRHVPENVWWGRAKQASCQCKLCQQDGGCHSEAWRGAHTSKKTSAVVLGSVALRF